MDTPFPDGGYGEDPLLVITDNQVAIGRFLVDVFFALSGFLIANSWARSTSPLVFIWHRILRIYPAYLICLAVTSVPIAYWLTGKADWSYLGKNLLLIFGVTQRIEGLFSNNPGGPDVNSSLWTLPWEIRAYVLLGIIGAASWLERRNAAILIFFITWSYFSYTIISGASGDMAPMTTWPRLLTFFFSGVAAYRLRSTILLDGRFAAISLLVLVLATVVSTSFIKAPGGGFYIIAPFCLTYFFFWLAYVIPAKNINSTYDVSYGIYIYGTLILQTLVAEFTFKSHIAYLSSAMALTFLAAFLSWHFVESPALRLKNMFSGH